jgi:flagellar biosynthesis/type III secretory pathway chaperone
MNKEQYLKEVEMAFEIFEKLETIDYQSWHRVISIVEQLRNDSQRQKDLIEKQLYYEQMKANGPVVVR